MAWSKEKRREEKKGFWKGLEWHEDRRAVGEASLTSREQQNKRTAKQENSKTREQ